MKAEELKGKVDFGVITIREDEFKAILQRFPPHDTIRENRIYNIHRMPLSDTNENYVIATVRCPEQGPIKAQSVAMDLIRDLDPQWILLVGIAGGFPDDEFTLGDVVAAMRLHDFSVEAVIEGKPSEYADHGGPMHKAVQVLLANLPAMKKQLGDWNQETSIGQPRPSVELEEENFYGDDEWRKKVKKAMNAHFGKTAQPRLPKAVTAAIVSSGKLVKDSETLKQWFQNARDLRAMEMELAGVYEAAHQMDPYPVLAVRGISDIVGFNREPQWTGYACHTAAAFAHALLKTRPIEPKATLSAQDNPDISLPDIPLSRHRLREPVRDFIGRDDEIAELMGKIDQGGVAISGMHGMGGIGKTELALKLAETLTDRYPDGQFLIELKGASKQPLSSADAMAQVIRIFYPESKLPDGETKLHGLYQEVLRDKRMLLLMDDAANAKQLTPLVPPKSSLMLVTSRRHFSLPGCYAKNIDALRPKDAREMLMNIAGRVSSESADRICYLCGQLPLAVRAAGSLLAVNADWDPADYAERLRNERDRLKLLRTDEEETGIKIEVEASFNLSYENLKEDAAEIFRSLSVFPSSFDAEAEENICGDREHARLTELMKRSLVMYDERTKRYSLHDLVRVFADGKLSDEERAACRQRHAEFYKNVLSLANDLYKRGGEHIQLGLSLFDIEATNIYAGQKRSAENAALNDVAAQLCSDYSNVGAYVLNLRLHAREQIDWLEAALKAAQRLKNRGEEGAHLGNLGLAYADLGEVRRAIEYYEQRLVIAREIGDRRGEGNALYNMALSLYDLGNREQAVANAEAALKIYEQIESPNTKLAQNKLAQWRGQE